MGSTQTKLNISVPELTIKHHKTTKSDDSISGINKLDNCHVGRKHNKAKSSIKCLRDSRGVFSTENNINSSFNSNGNGELSQNPNEPSLKSDDYTWGHSPLPTKVNELRNHKQDSPVKNKTNNILSDPRHDRYLTSFAKRDDLETNLYNHRTTTEEGKTLTSCNKLRLFPRGCAAATQENHNLSLRFRESTCRIENDNVNFSRIGNFRNTLGKNNGETAENIKELNISMETGPAKSVNPFIAHKPPTPPPKLYFPKRSSQLSRNSQNGSFSSLGTIKNSIGEKPTLRTVPRTGYSATGEWLRSPGATLASGASFQAKRTSSLVQNRNDFPVDTNSLSRIEYTFYICDDEAHQRPFHDRRVESITRACMCTVRLHKPSNGQKPIFYKGIRVLPVTISARTMSNLKRCLARLDMSFPQFNVKAFCPPDMY